jgi:hypothetical protein
MYSLDKYRFDYETLIAQLFGRYTSYKEENTEVGNRLH